MCVNVLLKLPKVENMKGRCVYFEDYFAVHNEIISDALSFVISKCGFIGHYKCYVNQFGADWNKKKKNAYLNSRVCDCFLMFTIV